MMVKMDRERRILIFIVKADLRTTACSTQCKGQAHDPLIVHVLFPCAMHVTGLCPERFAV